MFNPLVYKHYLIGFIVFLYLLISACSPNSKPIPTPSPPIRAYNYWAVFNSENQVYATSFPLISNTITKNRDLHYFMVVYDKINQGYIITIVAGKELSPLSEVIIKVNYNEYYLPIAKDRAWLTNPEYVRQLIEDMLQSNELIVINTFEDNTQALDTYGLKGFNDAISKVEQTTGANQLILETSSN